jgi:hypothetical protein
VAARNEAVWTDPSRITRTSRLLRRLPIAPPASTGALEAKLDWLREQLKGRAFSLRNRERINRMLRVIQLHLNHAANELAYSKTGWTAPVRHEVRSWISATTTPCGSREFGE